MTAFQRRTLRALARANFEAAQADALATLRNGYDPERENGAPRRSDAWGLALGWQDAIGEEARERIEAKDREAFA